MPRLADRIDNVLNESRMLLLGGQVLLGFTYRIVFEPVFARLPWAAQLAEVTALAVMSAGLVWLIWPAAYHRIAEHGRLSQHIHEFTTTVLDWALLPFCLGLGLGFYPVCVALRIPHPTAISIATSLLAMTAWYGSGALKRGGGERRRQKPELVKEERGRGGDLGERIKQVLIECRMALPGAQAFLGFQFAIVFTETFGKVPRSLQWIHFGSLVATTIAIVLLIAPAAYHRLAEAGEDTERFHAVASYLLLGALVFLGPGMAGDLYLVIEMIAHSRPAALLVAGGLLVACYALWFGLSLLRRRPHH
jgi:Family of unknown function (DUF6328)